MKTLCLFQHVRYPDISFFFELDGDRRDLNGLYINSTDDLDILQDTVYEKDPDAEGKYGEYQVKELKEPTKDWDFFIMCGEV